MADTWPGKVDSAQTVAEMLDWVRRRTAGRALVAVMIGVNSVSVSRDPKLSAVDAIDLLRREAESIERALLRSEQKKETRAVAVRQDT